MANGDEVLRKLKTTVRLLRRLTPGMVMWPGLSASMVG